MSFKKLSASWSFQDASTAESLDSSLSSSPRRWESGQSTHAARTPQSAPHLLSCEGNFRKKCFSSSLPPQVLNTLQTDFSPSNLWLQFSNWPIHQTKRVQDDFSPPKYLEQILLRTTTPFHNTRTVSLKALCQTCTQTCLPYPSVSVYTSWVWKARE